MLRLPIVVDSLFVLALTGLGISILRFLVFAYLWRRESSPHLKLWALGFMVQIVSQVGSLPGLLGQLYPVVQALALVSLFIATGFLLAGTWRLVGRKPDWRWWTIGALGLVAASVVVAEGGSMLLATIVPVSFLSFAYLSMGVALFRRRREMSGLGVGLTIFSLAAIGIHFLDFPLLADVKWFVPWGIGIQVFNDLALTVGMVMLSFDRTHAARELADARYAELADTIGVGTYTATEPSSFSEVNGALVRMLGYSSAKELMAVDLSKHLLFNRSAKLDWDTLSEANAVWRRKDGRPLVVQVHARALTNPEGAVVACRGFVVDRTEAQAIEEALSRTQKLDAVGRLAGGVAHDFNNLLTIILSSLELLAVRPNDPTILRDAMEATDQAAQLIRRLLAFGRRQAHHAEPVEVGATALRTSEMLSRSLGNKHKLHTSGIAKGLWTNMDAGQLEQVLVNLVLNAKDAMAEGGVIEISTRLLKRGEQDGVELVVKDTGHGMKPEDKARIFEPFFTTREPGRGTGLGLSTVHGIVIQAGGHIEVESEVGKGSRFALWFPVTTPPSSQESRRRRVRRQALHTRRAARGGRRRDAAARRRLTTLLRVESSRARSTSPAPSPSRGGPRASTCRAQRARRDLRHLGSRSPSSRPRRPAASPRPARRGWGTRIEWVTMASSAPQPAISERTCSSEPSVNSIRSSTTMAGLSPRTSAANRWVETPETPAQTTSTSSSVRRLSWPRNWAPRNATRIMGCRG